MKTPKIGTNTLEKGKKIYNKMSDLQKCAAEGSMMAQRNYNAKTRAGIFHTNGDPLKEYLNYRITMKKAIKSALEKFSKKK